MVVVVVVVVCMGGLLLSLIYMIFSSFALSKLCINKCICPIS